MTLINHDASDVDDVVSSRLKGLGVQFTGCDAVVRSDLVRCQDECPCSGMEALVTEREAPCVDGDFHSGFEPHPLLRYNPYLALSNYP